MSILLPILYFVVPFFLLLPRSHKRSPVWLAFIAGWVLIMHAYDLYWQILPVLHPDTIHFHLLEHCGPRLHAWSCAAVHRVGFPAAAAHPASRRPVERNDRLRERHALIGGAVAPGSGVFSAPGKHLLPEYDE